MRNIDENNGFGNHHQNILRQNLIQDRRSFQTGGGRELAAHTLICRRCTVAHGLKSPAESASKPPRRAVISAPGVRSRGGSASPRDWRLGIRRCKDDLLGVQDEVNFTVACLAVDGS